MDKLIKFLSESNNFALILSSLVSICVAITATITAVYQSKKQYRETSMKLYFDAQYEAYTELYRIASDLDRDLKPKEIRDVRELVAAAKKAELLSPHHVAEIIDNFCAVYFDFLDESDTGEISKEIEEEFKTSLNLLTMYLREELLRYDFHHKHGKKIRKSLKKLYLKYSKE